MIEMKGKSKSEVILTLLAETVGVGFDDSVLPFLDEPRFLLWYVAHGKGLAFPDAVKEYNTKYPQYFIGEKQAKKALREHEKRNDLF